MSRRAAIVLLQVAALAGCATKIHPPKDPIQDATVRLGTYSRVTLAPLKVQWMEGDSGDEAAVRHMEGNLSQCMRAQFSGLMQEAAAGEGLLIEPIIVDLKKVNTSERVFLGAMAGSSAVLLKVRYTDAATKQVVAEPTFYAKGSAMSGAWSFGASDNSMLRRVVNEACDYARKNK